MTTRLLPPEEWPRLDGTLLDPAWRAFDPQTARVAVVEADGEIVACVSLFQGWHLEGAWIAERHRGRVSVGRTLLRSAAALCAEAGAREVFVMAVTDEGRALAGALGVPVHLACDHYAVQVGVTHGRP